MQTKFIGIFLLGVVASDSYAGGGGGAAGNIVFDPTNYVETTISAERSVYAETQRATQIYNQMQHYRQTLLQNQTTNPAVLASLLTQNAQDINSVQAYVSGLARLLDDASQQRNMANNRIVDMKNSGLGFDEYAQRESERIAAGNRQRVQLIQHERSIMENVSNDAKFVQDMQAKIPASIGLHDSARDMNTMLNKIVAQNATLIQWQVASSASSRDAALEKEKKMEDQELVARGAATKRNATLQSEIDRLNQPAPTAIRRTR